VEPDPIRQHLTALRDEALALAQSQSITREQVDEWRTRTSEALLDFFGAGSEAVQDFARIRFDYADIVDLAERHIKESAVQHEVDISATRIELPPAQKALRAGLYEAADLLTSLI